MKRWIPDSPLGHVTVGVAVAGALVLTGPVTSAVGVGHVAGVAATAACLAIAVLGMDLILGVADQFHLGQAAFVAIGAYGFAILRQDAGLTTVPAAVLAILAAGIAGLAMAWVFFRLGALLFAVGTLAVGAIALNVIGQLRSVTGGADGKALQPVAPLGFQLSTTTAELVFVAIVLGLCVMLTRAYATGARGRLLHAVGRDPVMASSLGIDVRLAKVEVTVVASLLAGLSGVCLAAISRIVAPGVFSIETSIVFVVAVVLGRPGSIVGPVLALVLLETIPELVDFFAGRLDLLVGLLLVSVLLVGGRQPSLVQRLLPPRSGSSEAVPRPRQEGA